MNDSDSEYAPPAPAPTPQPVSGDRPPRLRRDGKFVKQPRNTPEPAVEDTTQPLFERARSPTSRMYEQLIENRTAAMHNGDLNTTYRIQACINIGMKLGWTKEAVIALVKRTGRRFADGDHLRPRFDAIWEVDAEIERLVGRNSNEFMWLRSIQARYIGVASDQADEGELVVVKCAPLILIRAQAAINVAFAKSFTEAIEAGEDFEVSIFEQRAVYQFRVPGNETSEAMDYLLQRSNIGQKRLNSGDNHGVLLPGIERPLNTEEKEEVAGSMVVMENGRKLTQEVLAVLEGHREHDAGRSGIAPRESVFETAMRTLNDAGWLVLDYCYRVKRGWGVVGVSRQVPCRVVVLKAQCKGV
ncbi:hypothetical protein H2198_003551 [Neophaeococcomyces mojaviensis]|uniref:Uncharacterized protein n=1 Tax=Neophaeococcomyces mojaviensis TaxID=3383035 RepID=A0ACC3AB16_9EURO|nr:hypothetical protein H2198_003551 [Knufia sp. JES_112]